MSIDLELKPYCHNCSNFSPETEKLAMKAMNNDVKFNYTKVKCEYADQCNSIYNHIKHELTEESGLEETARAKVCEAYIILVSAMEDDESNRPIVNCINDAIGLLGEVLD